MTKYKSVRVSFNSFDLPIDLYAIMAEENFVTDPKHMTGWSSFVFGGSRWGVDCVAFDNIIAECAERGLDLRIEWMDEIEEPATKQTREFERTWVVTADGSYAWKWTMPTRHVSLKGVNVDEWIERATDELSLIVRDDRNAPAGNVWD